MTPTTPPAIPCDIPRETWEAARPAYDELFRLGAYRGASVVVDAQAVIARALLAAQERGKLMERERCAADLEIIAGKLVQRANDAFNGRDQGSAIILKSQADALIESAAAIREAN